MPYACLLGGRGGESFISPAVQSERIEAWAQLLHTVRTGEPAFRRAFGQDLYAYLAAYPDIAAIFHGGEDGGSATTASWGRSSISGRSGRAGWRVMGRSSLIRP